LTQLLTAAPFKKSKADFTGAAQSYAGLVSEPAYMCMVAAMDMFLYRFPTNPYATVRVGTIASRYKDCSVFTSLGQTIDTAAIPIEELYRWMFVREVAEEAYEMMQYSEELDKEYSYAAYLSDFRLVNKSLYSAVANPRLHSWLHTLGSLLLAEMSLNARHLSDASFHPILANTALLAFVRRRATGFAISYVDTQRQADEEGKEMDKPERSVATAGMPSTIVAANWFIWLAGEGFVLPESIYQFLHRTMSGAPPLRDGSIGKKV
ncbi:unnamed protein product, partial [Ixodes persulcatus]